MYKAYRFLRRPACQDLQAVYKVNVYLFICTGTATHYTSLAIHQRRTICGSAQEKMGTVSVPKSLQESLQKRRQQAAEQ